LRQQLREADVVILQKELVSVFVLKLLRMFSRRLIYDFDDAVYLRLLSDGNCRPSKKRAQRFTSVCRLSDLVIAGNPILEFEARRCGARCTAILPTGVKLPKFQNYKTPTNVPVRLGWIGTDVNLPYIESLESIFLQLQSEGLLFSLHVMAGRPPKFKKFSALEFVVWSPDTEDSFLASLDIGLMPLADNPHARGKCAYKALQYMSVGIAVIVSDVGINAEWISRAGFAVSTSEQMLVAARTLITNFDLRAQMGAFGRLRIENEFSRPIIAQRLRELISACK
jgi:glycosyltransferase involved in cell wall biosynthesis